jgi:hypothetical protein
MFIYQQKTLKVTSTPLHSIGLSNILNIETVNRSFLFKLPES